jgi:hypothetical protein
MATGIGRMVIGGAGCRGIGGGIIIIGVGFTGTTCVATNEWDRTTPLMLV